MLTQEELEKCENPYEEIAKMAKGLVEELKEKEYDRGYENGMEDAWDTVKKLYLSDYGLVYRDLEKIFGDWEFETILTDNSAKEAKEKIDNYIKKKNTEFHVGDEITVSGSDVKYVIFSTEDLFDKDSLYAIDNNGISAILCSKEITKTGRHFDEAEELFRKMKEN